LPEQFRDSPQVVAELSRQGADFVAGPTEIKLESWLLASEEAVWATYYCDEERAIRFDALAG